MDSWIEIIIRLPILAIVLIAVFSIGAAVIVTHTIQKKRTDTNRLILENENLRKLQKAFDDLKARSDITREAYINFLYNVSHEVSNPLQSIQTNLDNLARCSPDEIECFQQYTQIISADIRRLATLTERLRALSRLETPNRQITREPVNLKGVIETIIMSQGDYAEERGVRLTYHGPDRLTRILANRDDLEQVFTNLVGNSIKYSKEDGGEVIISVQEESDVFRIRVLDNGVGIPDEDLPHIFDVAYRSPETYLSRRKGTGLGLAIVKQIVEQHGGTITAHSKLGEGTTINIEFPNDNTSRTAQPGDQEQPPQQLGVDQSGPEKLSRPKAQAWLACNDGYTYQLNLGETTLGRSSKNDIQLSEGDNTVSRRHIKILEQNGHFTLFDIPGKGTTRVNGQVVHHLLLLNPNDDIQLGDNTHLRLVVSEAKKK